MIKADGWDDCVLGIAEDRIVYSMAKMLEKHMAETGEACMYAALSELEFNVFGSYVGEDGPIYCDDIGDHSEILT